MVVVLKSDFQKKLRVAKIPRQVPCDRCRGMLGMSAVFSGAGYGSVTAV